MKETMLHTVSGQIYNKYKSMIGKHTSMFASNTGEIRRLDVNESCKYIYSIFPFKLNYLNHYSKIVF